MGSATRAQVLFRDAEVLERLRDVDTVVFDKTGTLSSAHPEVHRVLGMEPDRVLSLAAAALAQSEHPLAQAIRDSAKDKGLAVHDASQFEAVPGRGGRATIEGSEIIVASRRWLNELNIAPGPIDEEAKSEEARGNTLSWLIHKGEVLGAIALAAPIRDTAASTIRELQRRGIEAILLTGDNEGAAKHVAHELGIERVFAGVRPEEKAAHIEALIEEGRRVAMVGDGINDAAALAVAEVGFAMGGGADVAVEAAGVTLMRSDPQAVLWALDIAKATRNKIRQNLFWAFVYNIIGLPLAALGLLAPAFAAAALASSSVSVVSNALLLKRWRPG
jgi:Cu+-exporting ATPase